MVKTSLKLEQRLVWHPWPSDCMVQHKLEFSIELSIDKYSDGTINYDILFYFNCELYTNYGMNCK